MKPSHKLNLTVTLQEYEYLNSLLQDEVFQLSGVKKISKIEALAEKLRVASALEKKLEEAKLAAA